MCGLSLSDGGAEAADHSIRCAPVEMHESVSAVNYHEFHFFSFRRWLLFPPRCVQRQSFSAALSVPAPLRYRRPRPASKRGQVVSFCDRLFFVTNAAIPDMTISPNSCSKSVDHLKKPSLCSFLRSISHLSCRSPSPTCSLHDRPR